MIFQIFWIPVFTGMTFGTRTENLRKGQLKYEYNLDIEVHGVNGGIEEQSCVDSKKED